ncbi:hypothetical protein KIN20_017660 [Parelaphostrongylus tenuis]|uniref:Uncharacterized protein n=1 Tax=Parelaphostrongylus tenuis TaxID=148309 RepID=A0AAD5MIU2_PARTN|nr:hypothetical protein KIN20_017660 [Parelaphostrongylus tenuis]
MSGGLASLVAKSCSHTGKSVKIVVNIFTRHGSSSKYTGCGKKDRKQQTDKEHYNTFSKHNDTCHTVVVLLAVCKHVQLCLPGSQYHESIISIQ